MIVRIMADAQYRLTDDAFDRLRVLDDDLLAALESNDEAAFRRIFHDAVVIVRTGDRLGDQVLEPSDLVLPPEETRLDEAKRLLGLTP